MAFELPSWEGIKTNVGNFLSSDVAPIWLGGGAQAVMAEHPESWQYQLGGLAGRMAQSKIAAKAATRQATQRDAYNQMLADLLSGKSLTEAGTPGPTSANLAVNPDGTQKISVTGDKIVSPSDVGKAGQEGGQRTSRLATPTRAPAPAISRRALPFYLAASTGSSGGGGGSLYGLSPEQITNISRTDIMGGELSQRGVGEIYSNLQKQAYADYLGRLPAGTTPKPQLSFTDMKIDDKTKTWQFYDRVKGERVDTEIEATEDELSGSAAPNWSQQEYVTKDGVRRSGIFKDGKLATDLGVVPETTLETDRFRRGQRDLGEVETLIDDAGDDAVASDIDYFNQFSNGQYVYVVWGTNREVKRVKIPGGYKASDVYATAQKYGLSVADVIASLEANKPKR
jgi:hypothetical protein